MGGNPPCWEAPVPGRAAPGHPEVAARSQFCVIWGRASVRPIKRNLVRSGELAPKHPRLALLAASITVATASTCWMLVQTPNFLSGYDFQRTHLFYKTYFHDALLSGRLPLWNPYVGLGRPYMADIETASLYPPNLLVLLFGVYGGTAVSVLLHQALAVYCGVRLGEKAGASAGAGWLVGAGIALSSPFTGRLDAGILQGYCVLCWFPALLWLGASLQDRWEPRTAAGFAAAVGLTILAGHPPFAFLDFFGLAVFLACRQEWPSGRAGMARAARNTLGVASAAIIGTGLSRRRAPSRSSNSSARATGRSIPQALPSPTACLRRAGSRWSSPPRRPSARTGNTACTAASSLFSRPSAASSSCATATCGASSGWASRAPSWRRATACRCWAGSRTSCRAPAPCGSRPATGSCSLPPSSGSPRLPSLAGRPWRSCWWRWALRLACPASVRLGPHLVHGAVGAGGYYLSRGRRPHDGRAARFCAAMEPAPAPHIPSSRARLPCSVRATGCGTIRLQAPVYSQYGFTNDDAAVHAALARRTAFSPPERRACRRGSRSCPRPCARTPGWSRGVRRLHASYVAPSLRGARGDTCTPRPASRCRRPTLSGFPRRSTSGRSAWTGSTLWRPMTAAALRFPSARTRIRGPTSRSTSRRLPTGGRPRRSWRRLTRFTSARWQSRDRRLPSRRCPATPPGRPLSRPSRRSG